MRRLLQSIVTLTDATDAAEVLKHCLDKDDIYKFLQPISGEGSLFNTEYAVGKVRRQVFLPSYTPEKLSIYTDPMWRQSVRLTEALAPYAGKGPFRIEYILGGFCFDNIIGAADIEELRDEFSSAQMSFFFVSCLRLVVQRWTSLWMQTDLLHRLSSNHREMDKLLQNVFADSDRPFVKEDLTRTPYLDMVIKESLRIFSIVPFILRKTHTDTKLPCGRVIPAGAGIGIAIYSVLRDPKYWGPDADHFDPERFLPERVATVPDIAYKPFSYGPRSCPGYKFAQNVIKIGLCAILRRYKVVGTPAAGPVPHIATKYEIARRPVDDHIELVNRS
ncbi:cytochrome P450 6B1-like [Aricia agestis]|uniref:cytochrome P450 6B1-like n=1 Tax=Aricia agestis TaxID=91739 RepID=UPI001C2066CD|nr:cytochrome P450 6B1-like [Aricia agestis]